MTSSENQREAKVILSENDLVEVDDEDRCNSCTIVKGGKYIYESRRVQP